MRVVLDTNVLVSAVLGRRLREILTHWRAGDFTLIVSSEIMSEYIGVLQREKFGLPEELIFDISAYLLQQAEFVTPLETLDVVHADPSDNRFLEAAITGNADWIVSGDSHLLSLDQFQGIPIIAAREFLDQLGA